MFKAKYKTSADIANAINKNAKAHESVDAEWHDIGMSVMAHIWEHRDVSVCNNLVIPMYKGLGKGARHTAMTAWIIKFLPVVANIDQATKNTHPFKFDKAKAKLEPDFDAAVASPWYGMKPSPAPDMVFDATQILAMAIKRMKAAAADGKGIVGDRAQWVAAAKAFGIAESEIPEAGWDKTKAGAKAYAENAKACAAFEAL